MLAWLCVAAAAPFPDLMEAPPRPVAPRTGDAAVVVGVEDYGFLPDVPYAARDAGAVRTLLVHGMGVPPEHVQLLTAANREQLLTAVDVATGQVSPDGRLLVWFSGHGATSPVDGSMLLVGDDAKPTPDAFAARSVSVAEIAQRVQGEALVVIDACAAGQGRDGQSLMPGTRFAMPSWAASEPSLRVWTAAAPTQLAEPYHPAQHGLFTALAVGALRGWGDVDGDGTVTLDEAQDYVQRAMLSVGARQQPTLAGPDLVVATAGETGPSLAALPRLGGPMVPMPSPGGSEEGPAFRGPYRLGRGGVRTGGGQTVSLNVLLSELDVPEANKHRRQQQTASALGATGLGAAGLATVVGGYLAAFHAIYSSVGDTNLSLGTKLAVPGSVAAVGLGTGVGGLVVARKKRKAIVETLNAQ